MTKELIIVTGASSGIGAGIAKAFSDAGFYVGMLARNIEAMQALKIPNSICIKTDVTDHQSVKQAIRTAEQKFGPTACLINNAGLGKSGDYTEISHADHEAMISVNLNGVINCIEAVLPGMRARKSGTIINISSVADRYPRPNLPVYAATKAAVKSLSDSLRMANAKYGVRVCNVAPAKIKTPLLVKAGLSDNQVIEVEDFTKTILWIYQQPKNVCIRDIVVSPTHYEY